MQLSGKTAIFENNAILNKIRKFMLSDYYTISLVLLITLLWALNIVEATVLILASIACFTFVIQKDQTPIIPLGTMCSASIAAMSFKSTAPGWVLLLFAAPFFIGLIFNIIYYADGKVKIGPLTYPYIAVFIALALGGIFYQGESNKFMNVMMAMYIGLIPLALYLLLCNRKSNLEKEELVLYVAKSIFYFGLICVLELAIYFIKAKVNGVDVGIVNIGWGISNTVGASLSLAIPFGMYLVYKEKSLLKSIIYTLITIAEFIMIFSTESRGASLFGTAVMLASIVIILVKSKGDKRKMLLIFYSVAIVVGAIVLVFWGIAIKDKLLRIFHDGLDGNGRESLFREAIKCFEEYPTFGVGLCYVGDWQGAYNINMMYFFHNTILQVLASLGIVGGFAYTYLYVHKIKLLCASSDTFSLLSVVAFFGFEGYALMNTGTFLGFPFGVITTIILYVLQIINNEKTQEIQLNKKMKQKVKLCGEKI